MTNITKEKRAELRSECERQLAHARKFRNYIPTTVVETLDLAALLDALDARDAERAVVDRAVDLSDRLAQDDRCDEEQEALCRVVETLLAARAKAGR